MANSPQCACAGSTPLTLRPSDFKEKWTLASVKWRFLAIVIETDRNAVCFPRKAACAGERLQTPASERSARGSTRFTTLPVPLIRLCSRRWRSTRDRVSGAMPSCAAISRLRWRSSTASEPASPWGSAWWMTTRLDLDSIYIPFIGMVTVGWLIFSLVVVIAMVVTYAGSVIDGVDGLSGGVFSIMYMTMGLLAFLQSRYDLAALCFAIVGGLLAFLWHNIPPAKFMLSDVGSMPLTLVLAILAILTDSVVVLPISARV